MPIFRWIYPKIMGKGQFFGALRAHKMLILLNFAQKSLSCNPPPPPHSEEYSPMPMTAYMTADDSLLMVDQLASVS